MSQEQICPRTNTSHKQICIKNKYVPRTNCLKPKLPQEKLSQEQIILRTNCIKNKLYKEHSLSKQVSNVATVIDELEYTNIAAKTTDLEEVDKETIHFLVFLFMQYLSHPGT